VGPRGALGAVTGFRAADNEADCSLLRDVNVLRVHAGDEMGTILVFGGGRSMLVQICELDR